MHCAVGPVCPPPGYHSTPPPHGWPPPHQGEGVLPRATCELWPRLILSPHTVLYQLIVVVYCGSGCWVMGGFSVSLHCPTVRPSLHNPTFLLHHQVLHLHPSFITPSLDVPGPSWWTPPPSVGGRHSRQWREEGSRPAQRIRGILKVSRVL